MIKNYCKVNIFILLLCLCGHLNGFSQHAAKVYADPASVVGIKAARFIDRINFIPLQSMPLFKNKSTNALHIVAGENIAILDRGGNCVYIFERRTGKFLYRFKPEKKKYKVNTIQYVPAKDALLIMSRNDHYTIGEKKALQLVERWKGRDISKFVRMDLIYLGDNFKREQMKVPSIALNADILYFGGGFLYRNYTNNKYVMDSVLYRLVQYGSDNRIQHRYFPFLNLNGLWSDYYRYRLPLVANSTESDDRLLFQLDFSPTIYELRPDTLIEKYRFVFPMANIMPPDFNSLSFKNNIDYQKYLDKHNEAFAFNSNMFEHGNYLIFQVFNLVYQGRQFMLLNNTLYDLEKTFTDSSMYNLPPTIFGRIFGQDKSFLYAYMSAAEVLRYKDALIKNDQVGASFKHRLLTLTAGDNDIILQIKLK